MLADHNALLGKFAVDDPAERVLGAGTNQLQVFGQISLSGVFAIGHAKTNGDVSRKLNLGKKTRMRL